MKFFKCCSSEATQTVEPEILPDKTDHVENGQFRDVQHSSYSSTVDVS